MLKKNEPSIWSAPDIQGGVILQGRGKSPQEQGDHRFFVNHSQPPSGYRYVQSSDYVRNPCTNREQPMTIPAAELTLKQMDVDITQRCIRL